MSLIPKNTDLELPSRNVLQLDGAGETLVLLGVVVLEADLEVHRLEELPLLLLGAGLDGHHALPQDLSGNLAHDGMCSSKKGILTKEEGDVFCRSWQGTEGD